MGTTIKHGQMTVVDDDGNLSILYQESSAADVIVDRATNANIPTNTANMQQLANKLGQLAFKSTEINDEGTSQSLTWSSKKIADTINALDISHNFYVALIEGSDGNYTSQKTVAEIEAAYQSGKPIWVIASEIFIPLRQRTNANTWVFSGYTNGQAYDITITASGVTFNYTTIEGLQTVYDAASNTVTFI